jgi:hypothetical protein
LSVLPGATLDNALIHFDETRSLEPLDTTF